MQQVAVYASDRRSNALRKEGLIYDSINLALDSMADVDWRRPAMPEASRPGLREIRSHEKVVALGRAAHTILADYHKRTLVAADDDEDGLDEDVERLVWSCVNTMKVVALGKGAWRSVQILPFAERRYYEVPPLRLAAARDGSRTGEIVAEVLVINHEDDASSAEQVVAALQRDGYSVQRTGRGGDGEGNADHGGWSATAPIHVHVGYHDSRVEEMRLLDTWHSRRLAILMLPRGSAETPPAGTLMVDPEVNGFVCDSARGVLAACADVRSDAVLRKKILQAGTVSAAPLAREWLTIAAELLC